MALFFKKERRNKRRKKGKERRFLKRPFLTKWIGHRFPTGSVNLRKKPNFFVLLFYQKGVMINFGEVVKSINTVTSF